MLGAGILAFFYHVVSFHTRPDQKPRQVCLLKKKFEKQMVTQKESLWGRDLIFKKNYSVLSRGATGIKTVLYLC